jgi:two-component system capsular synthesis sensor histidine kinase RcsC
VKNDLDFKRMFVRYISHEVRTPLNTAIMGLELLTGNIVNHANRDTLNILDDIKKAADIALGVLNEILIFDKIEDGTLTLNSETFSIVEFLENVVQEFQIQVKN